MSSIEERRHPTKVSTYQQHTSKVTDVKEFANSTSEESLEKMQCLHADIKRWKVTNDA
ncbi:hypothetical protein HanPSC8_Chr13g0592451 [Helianthus annuus]|nr:hypothetical protein HanPSC8_Chr13g0592451 [Helianthus annuus]